MAVRRQTPPKYLGIAVRVHDFLLLIITSSYRDQNSSICGKYFIAHVHDDHIDHIYFPS